ncbi:MAG TPA: hypothetical protein VK255_00585 [Patescibacteria group bacterium]|nr:hypothetical protein [Patescibacteria group bacterium]
MISALLIFMFVLAAALLVAYLKRKRPGKEWKGVKKLAKSKGWKLRLVSDKEYFKRKRPMPRGGMLYQSGLYICVRYEHVSPKKAKDFIERISK